MTNPLGLFPALFPVSHDADVTIIDQADATIIDQEESYLSKLKPKRLFDEAAGKAENVADEYFRRNSMEETINRQDSLHALFRFETQELRRKRSASNNALPSLPTTPRSAATTPYSSTPRPRSALDLLRGMSQLTLEENICVTLKKVPESAEKSENTPPFTIDKVFTPSVSRPSSKNSCTTPRQSIDGLRRQSLDGLGLRRLPSLQTPPTVQTPSTPTSQPPSDFLFHFFLSDPNSIEEEGDEFNTSTFEELLHYCDGQLESKALKAYLESVFKPEEILKLSLNRLFDTLNITDSKKALKFLAHTFSSVQQLSLQEVALPGSCLDEVAQFQNLQQLDLSDSLQMCLQNPKALAHFNNLKNLILRKITRDDAIDDTTFSYICELRGLEDLNIQNANITDYSFINISKLRFLSDLTLSGCSKLTSLSTHILAQLPNLKNLDISKTQFSCDDLLYLARNSRSLRTICIERNKFSMDDLRQLNAIRRSFEIEANDGRSFAPINFIDEEGQAIDPTQPLKRIATRQPIQSVASSGTQSLF